MVGHAANPHQNGVILYRCWRYYHLGSMDYLLAQLENGSRWMWLLEELDEAASSRKVYGGVPDRTKIVASKSTIVPVVQHYMSALEGKTYICCGNSGSGKTTAAMYLLHGDYDFRPQRGILVRAADQEDFATEFAKLLGAPDAAPIIHNLLVRALKPKEMRRTVHVSSMWALIDSFRSKLWRKKCFAMAFETELIQIAVGGLTGPPRTRENCTDLPLLIIDGLTKSEKNKSFVGRLYEQVTDENVSALIMVKDENWADELIKLNGGVKILPVDQVIDNPRGQRVDIAFTTKPQWKKLLWDLEGITAFASLEGITDVEMLADGMTPQQVLDLHRNVSGIKNKTPKWGQNAHAFL
jgi:hypothetical protein